MNGDTRIPRFAQEAAHGIRVPPGWTATVLPRGTDLGVPLQIEVAHDPDVQLWLIAVQDGRVRVYYNGSDTPMAADAVARLRPQSVTISDALDRADAALARWLTETHTSGDL